MLSMGDGSTPWGHLFPVSFTMQVTRKDVLLHKEDEILMFDV